jgi:serine/threonine protein kinase
MFPNADHVSAVMGAEGGRLTVWAGKPDKIARRLFAYGLDGGGTVLIAKIGEHGDRWLEHEWATLADLRMRLSKDVGEALPDCVRYEDPILVQRWREGVSLTEVLVKARRARDRTKAASALHSAIDWLREFHNATAIRPAFGGCHGDFKPSNVLLASNRVSVIDWELYAEAPQEFDFWHLAAYAGFTCAGRHDLAGFRAAFVEPTWISRLVRECWEHYADPAARQDSGFERFRAYVNAALARRASFGLQNEGYFLAAIRDWLDAPGAAGSFVV